MATAFTPAVPSVPVEEYIARFVEGGEKPTCEYHDGELFPKSTGTLNHARVQGNLVRFLSEKYEDRYLSVPELTTRLQERHFLVPDVAVLDRSRPMEGSYPGPRQPVHLCIEILSPPDRFGKLTAKCEEYHAWGVPHCWLIDPDRQMAWEYMAADYQPRKAEGRLTAVPISLSFSEIFRGLPALVL